VYDCGLGAGWRAVEQCGAGQATQRRAGRWPVRTKQNSRTADANWVGRRFGQVGELRLWPERRLVVQVAEKQSRMQREGQDRGPIAPC
jgi:hypothetical protein